jgi:hypothetical protein
MKNRLYGMIQDGFEVKQKLRAASQIANPGSDWRGGNSGCMTDDGRFIGNSPKDAVLRHLGIEIPKTLDDDLIFEAGVKNEEHWTELLGHAKIPVRCEEEIPVLWSLPNGETIGGRPDTVVGKGTIEDPFEPDFGIEQKLISSNGKMVKHSHFANADPSGGHVCQAAHYSHIIGVDWVIAYTSRAHYAAFYFSASRFKFDHRAMIVDNKSGKVVSVKPFISMYDLTWDNDTALLDGTPTAITASGIQRFYQYCSDCVANKIIPVCGGDYDTWGKRELKNNNILYDDFAAATSTNFDDWLMECREIAEVS